MLGTVAHAEDAFSRTPVYFVDRYGLAKRSRTVKEFAFLLPGVGLYA